MSFSNGLIQDPKLEFEQYQTETQVAAEMLHSISTQGEGFENMHVLDLGCGPGKLGIGAAICGAE